MARGATTIQARRGEGAIVVVGAGLAGGNAAVTLREEGFKGAITLVGREPGVPFGRPPLSKSYLRSEEDLEGWLVRSPAWYDEHDVERLESSVVAVDVATHVVVLDSGQELDYQKVLIATGGRNRRLAVPGAQLPGIHYLRTVAECEAIKRESGANRNAVSGGDGVHRLRGRRLPDAARGSGHRTPVFPGQAPLERVLGDEVGAAFSAIHRANGVELRSQDQIVGFEGTEHASRRP